MVYAYFGGAGTDKRSRYELFLEETGGDYIVTAVAAQHRPPGHLAVRVAPWWWCRKSRVRAATTRLYRGGDVHIALRTLLRAARAANLAEYGQRYCYVLPSVPATPGALAALLPTQLCYDGSLPVHPQLWQVGRSLDTLPVEYHAQACTDGCRFGDEHPQWKLV